MKKYLLYVFIPLFLSGCIGGCDREKEFKLSVANRDSHEITAIVNGNVTATIPKGEARDVSVTVRMDDSSPTSSYHAQYADIVFNARRTDTGELSRGKSLQVRTDRANYIEVNKWDFSP